jgi:hypothetical protein
MKLSRRTATDQYPLVFRRDEESGRQPVSRTQVVRDSSATTYTYWYGVLHQPLLIG